MYKTPTKKSNVLLKVTQIFASFFLRFERKKEIEYFIHLLADVR